jgi:hypothetical protein
MKHAIASLTIGACLLLPSAGVVLAANPHSSNPSTVSGSGKGQPGSNHGTSCNTGSVGPGPGGSVSANGSPFNPAVTPPYAGNPGNPTGPGGTANANPAAVSQYDVACFQAP